MTRIFIALAALLCAGVVLAACGGTSEESAAGGSGGKLTLVAYSTPQEAYEELIPAFNKTDGDSGVSFSQSYGSSGDQARAVLAGLPADVVALSLAPDVEKLVKDGLVSESWAKDSFDGFVTNSVVVFAVRKGNPKNLRTWDDLVKPGVEVITPNPVTSGGARWNIMAAYGAQLELGRSEAQAEEYLQKLFNNVTVQDKSAREALQTFVSGKGDVLLSYENEAITAQQKDQALDYIVPDETILIQNPIAVTERGASKPAAKAFLDFVRSPAGQKVFAAKGYRPVRDELRDRATYPDPPKLFKIDELGGWSDVTDRFFDEEKGLIAAINKKLGVDVG